MGRGLREAWSVVLGWAASNFLAVAAITVISLAHPYLRSLSGLLLTTLIVGLPIGIAQWFYLRRIAPVSVLWILSISAGLLVFFLIGRVGPIGILGYFEGESISALTGAYSMIGILIGLIQALLLRSSIHRSLAWILATTSGFGLGMGLVLVLGLIDSSGILAGILVIILYSAATGSVIAWLSNEEMRPQIGYHGAG